MNISKKIIPLIIGAFFLTANANLPDEVIFINETSQDIGIIVSCSNDERTSEGRTIKIGQKHSFQQSIPCYPRYDNFYPKNIYIFNDLRECECDFTHNIFSNFLEKIDLEIIVKNFITNITYNKTIKEIKLNNFCLQPFYFPDNTLIIILRDKTD